MTKKELGGGETISLESVSLMYVFIVCYLCLKIKRNMMQKEADSYNSKSLGAYV